MGFRHPIMPYWFRIGSSINQPQTSCGYNHLASQLILHNIYLWSFQSPALSVPVFTDFYDWLTFSDKNKVSIKIFFIVIESLRFCARVPIYPLRFRTFYELFPKFIFPFVYVNIFHLHYETFGSQHCIFPIKLHLISCQ